MMTKNQTRKSRIVLDVICEYFDITKSELTGRSKKHPIALYRQTAYQLLTDCGLNSIEIADVMQRDSSTVREVRSSNNPLVSDYDTLRNILNKIYLHL